MNMFPKGSWAPQIECDSYDAYYITKMSNFLEIVVVINMENLPIWSYLFYSVSLYYYYFMIYTQQMWVAAV